jgi:uncharacterized protein
LTAWHDERHFFGKNQPLFLRIIIAMTISSRPFRDYSTYLRDIFGEKVQKISIDPGYTCPNRDGTKSRSGCTYCNTGSLHPSYARNRADITSQLEKGIGFFSKRKSISKFLAYFQSYSNTYNPISILQKDYETALFCPGVVGLVIGTRPDCITQDLAEYLGNLSRSNYVYVELGIESTSDYTLSRVNRCHTFAETVDAIHLLNRYSIPVGGHLIMGFPWESEDEQLEHARILGALPLHSLKLHHLQILRHTQLAREHSRSPFTMMQPEAYMALVIRFIELSNPNVIFQRFLADAPEHLLIAPRWGGVRNYQFAERLARRMKEQHSWQGKFYPHAATA